MGMHVKLSSPPPLLSLQEKWKEGYTCMPMQKSIACSLSILFEYCPYIEDRVKTGAVVLSMLSIKLLNYIDNSVTAQSMPPCEWLSATEWYR